MNKYVKGVRKDQVPIKNSFLVDRELNIYAGEYPGDKDDEKCRLKVDDIGAWGNFRHFYDLTEEGELNPYSRFLRPEQHHHRFPIRDCSIPASRFYTDVLKTSSELCCLPFSKRNFPLFPIIGDNGKVEKGQKSSYSFSPAFFSACSCISSNSSRSMTFLNLATILPLRSI